MSCNFVHTPFLESGAKSQTRLSPLLNVNNSVYPFIYCASTTLSVIISLFIDELIYGIIVFCLFFPPANLTIIFQTAKEKGRKLNFGEFCKITPHTHLLLAKAHEYWDEASGVESAIPHLYPTIVNPHEYRAERQLVRLERKTFKNVVTLHGKSKSIAFAVEKLCFYEVKPILLRPKSCPFTS